ncbi:hypothetical protein ACYSUW_15100 [Pseudomonas frederiksbergensis]
MNEGNSVDVSKIIKRERLKIKHERWMLRQKNKQIWRLSCSLELLRLQRRATSSPIRLQPMVLSLPVVFWESL